MGAKQLGGVVGRAYHALTHRAPTSDTFLTMFFGKNERIGSSWGGGGVHGVIAYSLCSTQHVHSI